MAALICRRRPSRRVHELISSTSNKERKGRGYAHSRARTQRLYTYASLLSCRQACRHHHVSQHLFIFHHGGHSHRRAERRHGECRLQRIATGIQAPRGADPQSLQFYPIVKWLLSKKACVACLCPLEGDWMLSLWIPSPTAIELSMTPPSRRGEPDFALRTAL